MRRGIIISILLANSFNQAEEPVTFQAPRSYEAQRYEADWQKNPFTLKTAPAARADVSFAKGLAIGSYYGDTEKPTVVVVNTKTGERTRLQFGQVASNGMLLKGFKHGSGRKNVVAEVTLGSETVQLHYNGDYMRQLAASEGGRSSTQGGAALGRTAAPEAPRGQPPQPAVSVPLSSTSQEGMPSTAQAPGNQAMPAQAMTVVPLPGMPQENVAASLDQTKPQASKAEPNSINASTTSPGPSLRRLITPSSISPVSK